MIPGATPMMPGAPMPGMMPGAPMPGMMPGAPMPGMMPGAMPGAMPGMMPGAMPGMMPGAMPGACPGMMPGACPGMMPGRVPGTFPGGYPVFSGALGANMYYKPIWSPKRENKLALLYQQVMADGVVTPQEIQIVLNRFGYNIGLYEAQWFLHTLDINRDGMISYPEFRNGVQQFVLTWPKTRNPAKPWKAHYAPGYNWTTHPGFPMNFRNLWRF